MKNIASIYVHFPFCKHKCPYCVFPVFFLGKNNSTDNPWIFEYICSLQKEISHTLTKYNHSDNKNNKNPPLKTLYFGGGTPSLIKPNYFSIILNEIMKFYRLEPNDTEISMELNPDSFTSDDIKGYLDLGINRFSLGVQSFENEVLENVLQRGHSIKKVIDSIEILQKLNVNNISWDLLMNLPFEKHHKNMFLSAKPFIKRYNPDHLSIYSLILEEDSIFAKKFGLKEGVSPMVSQDFAAEQYVK